MKRLLVALIFFSQITLADTTNIEFAEGQIRLANKVLHVKLAQNLAQQQRGLMFRKTPLAANSGMLFIYDYEKPLSFWMKNTFIPLSIAFFNRERELINIENMQPAKSILQTQVDVAKSAKSAQYALEMNQGWFQKNNVKPGHKFEFLPVKKRPKSSSSGHPKRSSGPSSK